MISYIAIHVPITGSVISKNPTIGSNIIKTPNIRETIENMNINAQSFCFAFLRINAICLLNTLLVISFVLFN